MLWIYLCEYNFLFLLFFSEKAKAATGDVLWKKMFLKISQIYWKTPSLEFFLINLEAFNTYFEKHLWTIPSTKINICLTVKNIF